MRDGKQDRAEKQYGAVTEKVADYKTIEGLSHRSGRQLDYITYGQKNIYPDNVPKLLLQQDHSF